MRILVIHAARPTTRQTTIDHLLSLRNHLPEHDVQYLHFQQPLTRDVENVETDLLVINYDYLNYRFSPLWPYMKKRHRTLARSARRVVAIAQDDFWANILLDNWCMDWGVDRILTPLESGLDKLYPRSIRSKEFRTVLTGYVPKGDPLETLDLRDRPIHLGQRVRAMSPHLGHIALRKSEQSLAFAEAIEQRGFRVDVSARVEDSFIGRAWIDFLASCQFTVGSKGGASMNDPYGLIYLKVQSYLRRHPNAPFSAVEERCFRGLDGKNEFTAVSPRLFEAARTRTCQILSRDAYLDILEPWQHYIPLDRDLRNLNEVSEVMLDIDRCQDIADNCHQILVESGNFGYEKFVSQVIEGANDQSRLPDRSWTRLCSELESARQVYEDLGPEWHDLIVTYFTESLFRRRHRSRTKRTVQSSMNLSLSKVEEMMRTRLDPAWFENQVSLYRNDPFAARCPWPWRPV